MSIVIARPRPRRSRDGIFFSLTSVGQEHDDSNLNEENNACDNEPEKDFIRWENAHPGRELRKPCCLTGHRRWFIARARTRCCFKIMTDVRRLTGGAGG